MVTFGSLFAGVGGFDLGMEAAGWQCGWQVEWDKDCQQVLAHHWPEVPRYGDVSNVRVCRCRSLQPRADGRHSLLTEDSTGTWSPGCACGGVAPVDCITFGSPCQDLSVAGKRAGLDGNRSGLFYEAIRIIQEMRDATDNAFPRWAIWENVVGALSSNGGADFGAVLDSLADAGALVIEWAVLDARWFGVPQRRRRVFVVACFDPAIAGVCPDPLLPVAARSGWNPPTSPAQGQGTTGSVAGGAGVGGSNLTVYGQSQFAGYTEGVNTLAASSYKRPEDNIVTHAPNVVDSLQARMGKGANAEGAADGHLIVTHTHTHQPSRKDSAVVDLTQRTPSPAGWSGSASDHDLAAPLLTQTGGLRTTDIDGATWVVER